MRRAKREVPVHFVFVFLEVGQGCPDDKASETVADEGQSAKLIAGTRLANVLLDLVCKPLAHIKYVLVGIVLVRGSAEEEGIR